MESSSSSSTALISLIRVLFVAVVLSLRARERSNRRIFCVSHFIPSIRYTSSLITTFRYSDGNREACSKESDKLPGHLPQMIYSIRFLRSVSPVMQGVSSPWQSFAEKFCRWRLRIHKGTWDAYEAGRFFRRRCERFPYDWEWRNR